MKKTLFIALAALTVAVQAQFQAGNLVVNVLGDGGSVSPDPQASALREFTPAGAPVGSDVVLVNLPGGRHVTNAYGETSEGNLSVSGDGKFLMVAGYDHPARGAGFDVLLTQRVVGRVSIANKSVTLSNTFVPSAGDGLRGLWSPDGDEYYVTGGDLGLLKGTFNTTPDQLLNPFPSSRYIREVRPGVIYFSGSNVGPSGGNGFGEYTGGLGYTPLFDTPNGASSRNWVVVGENTMYLATSTSGTGLVKLTRDPILDVWTVNYNLSGTGIGGIAVDGTTIYATSSAGTTLLRTTDTGSGFASWTTLATAGSNTRFRGLVLIPAGAAPETVAPDALTLQRGQIISGTIADLATDNNVALRLKKFFVANPTEAFVWGTLQGTTSILTPSSVTFRVKSRMVTGGQFRQELEQWNWNTSTYENLLNTNPFNTVYGTRESIASPATGKVNGSGRLQARIRTFPNGISANPPPWRLVD
ncbi:MAG: hypothetical protein KIS64_03665 [Fimbriimonadaceae bacterium]|nr:hypothetical protein [Fimbriimonadaceae bacterium]